MKKIFVLLLAAAMLLSLAACGDTQNAGEALKSALTPEETEAPMTFQQRLEHSAEMMKDVNSMHMDASIKMSLSMSINGQAQDLDMDMSYAVDVQEEPLKMKGSMDLSAMGESQSVLLYMEQDGSAFNSYMSNDNGATWTSQTVKSPEEIGVPIQDTDQQMSVILDCEDSFTETGKETFNGSPATVYSGIITGEDVKKAIEAAGTLESLPQSLGGEVTEDMLQNMGEMPVTVAIDDATGYVVRYSMDMTAPMQSIMSSVLEASLKQSGLEGMEFQVDIKEVTMEIAMSQFDSVEEIVIPAEALGSKDETKETAGEQGEKVYKLTGVIQDGEDQSETLEMMEQMNMSMLLVLNDDGTGYLDLYGEKTELTWDEETITAEGEPVPYTRDGDTITLASDSTTLTFTLVD